MTNVPVAPPDLPRVRFDVRYRLADYRAFMFDHLATRAPRMGRLARSLASWRSSVVFAVKSWRLGACSFTVDGAGIMRTALGGSTQFPWADVAAVHRYRTGYLVDTLSGAIPLPYRELDAARRAALDTLFEWHEAADASLSLPR